MQLVIISGNGSMIGTKITGYVEARMVNYNKCPVYVEDMDDITFLTDKLIAEGLSTKEANELKFLRKLNRM